MRGKDIGNLYKNTTGRHDQNISGDFLNNAFDYSVLEIFILHQNLFTMVHVYDLSGIL